MIYFWGLKEKICFLIMVIDRKRMLCFIRDWVYGVGGRFMEL